MPSRKLYNEDVKLEYLSTFESEDVRQLIYFLFLKSKSAEEFYQKDLFSFNLNQIDDVMININPSTLNSVANNKSRINNYIRWAIKNGRRMNNLNPLQGTGEDWAIKFIDKTTKRHLSTTELYDLTENLYNAQDRALIQCIFEGISGRGMSELLSMNFNNIDWITNEVRVRDSKTDEFRTVKVSGRCMELIKSAYTQGFYLSEDTETTKELVDHMDYIFKNIKWRSTKNLRVSRGNLVRRLDTIRRKYELDEFSVVTISESGRIAMAAKLLETHGELTKEEFALIGDQFNITKTANNNYEYYNTTVMRNYINQENLKKLYGIDVTI